MKYISLILFAAFFNPGIAQNIYEYEQKIELTDDFSSQDINFPDTVDSVELSGTLIYPKKGFKKVVMIVPGSGKDTRHSHFVLAEQFLLNDIAVYRFDERGIGRSGGKYNFTATSLEKDVMAAFDHLKSTEILSSKKIGILGHSLGGIASIGAFGKGCDFDFLIQMATPVEDNGAFIEYQALTNIVGFYSVKNKTTDEVIHFIEMVRKMVEPDASFKTIKKKSKAIMKRLDFRGGKHIVNPLIIDLMQQNHEKTYQTSDAPILFIIGSNDRIVSSTNEIQTLKKLNNPNITIAHIENVNHWLSELKNPTEMSKPLYFMSETAIMEIINWTRNVN